MAKEDQLIFQKLVDELGFIPQDERVDERIKELEKSFNELYAKHLDKCVEAARVKCLNDQIKELEAKLQEISRECEIVKSTNPDDGHDA